MLIQILCDNPNSWIVPFVKEWLTGYPVEKYKIKLIHTAEDVLAGEILLLLSCEKLFTNLHLNKHNLVVHESALPHGKGWSPLTWQVIEGKNRIPVTLIEANDEIDSGPVYEQVIIELDGTELVEELRIKQAKATFDVITSFLEKYPEVEAINQSGESTFYRRRSQKDSEMDISKSLIEQFDLLRVCDNEKYPAHFYINDTKYILKIYKEK